MKEGQRSGIDINRFRKTRRQTGTSDCEHYRKCEFRNKIALMARIPPITKDSVDSYSYIRDWILLIGDIKKSQKE